MAAKTADQPPITVGQTATRLYETHGDGQSWWHVVSEDPGPEDWRDAPCGHYAPFDNILSGDDNPFHGAPTPTGTVVKVTVEVLRVGR